MIYSYRKVDKFLISELIKEELWATCPTEFNDNYEMSFLVDYDEIYTWIKYDNNLLNKFVEKYAPNNQNLIDNEHYYMSYIHNFICDIIDGIKSDLYVRCFSKYKKAKNMLGLYADSYKGVVLGYDENEFSDNELVDIDYDDDFCLSKGELLVLIKKQLGFMVEMKEYKRIIKSILKNKYKDWENEGEIRLFQFNENKELHKKINRTPVFPKEIYICERTAPVDILTIKNIVISHNYKKDKCKLYQMITSLDRNNRGIKCIPICLDNKRPDINKYAYINESGDVMIPSLNEMDYK